MADFDNTISLWKRKPKETDVAGKAYPHYTGKLNVDGKVKDLSVWIQTDPERKKKNPNIPDMSGKVQEVYKKSENNNEEIPY